MNADTPRTDAEIEEVSHYDLEGYRPYECISVNFARTLERELTQANQKIQELEKDKERLEDMLAVLLTKEERSAIDSAIAQEKESK